MQPWKTLKLRYGRSKFCKPERLVEYINSMLPEQDGSRLLAVGYYNGLHHWTLGLVARSHAESYVHIDAHPDDMNLNIWNGTVLRAISCGSFVHRLQSVADIDSVRMIGPPKTWCSRSRRSITHDTDIEYRRRMDWMGVSDLRGNGSIDYYKLDNFLENVDNIYLSVDLDILYENLKPEELCALAGWMAKNKRIKGADIYPTAYDPQPRLVKKLAEAITSV